MGKKTYASYKDEIYDWVALLDELGLFHNNSQSAHIEFDKYALQNKKLQSVKVMIKNEDDEFVEAVKNEFGEYVEKEIKNTKKSKTLVNSKINNKNKDKSIETSNSRKRPTNAQLPNGEVISWVSLLERYNLDHNERRSAHIEWDEYVLSEKGLPNVKEVPKNGEIIYKNGNDENIQAENCINLSRRPISANIRGLAWMRYIGKNIPEGTCYCCKIRTIHFTDYEVAHDKPFSKGGDETLGNIRPICSACNKDISNRYTIEEYIEIRGLKKDIK